MTEHDDKVELPPIEVEDVVSAFSQITDWGLKQLNIPKTWSVTRGGGMTAMVIDTGHPVHTDIGDNAIRGENFIEGEPIEDENGHQTHCTGIICAKHNEFGMVGVAPEAKCISVKALAKSGSGSFWGLVNALNYAIEVKPDVVSMSLGSPTEMPLIGDKIKTLYDMNIPVVCAAGNTGTGGVNWPAAHDETIAVAAYDKYGNIAGFSSRGDKVEWAAPGVGIYSTFLRNGYASLSGTSMACPFITGVILLMLAKHKKQEELLGGENDCQTVEQIREHLLKYTDDKGAVGRDSAWGYGVIDVEDLILDDEGKPIKKPVKPTPTPVPVEPPPVEEEPVEEEPVEEEPVEEEPVEEEPEKPESPKKKKDNKSLIIIGVVALLAIIGFSSSKGCESEEPQKGYLEKIFQ